MFISEWHSVISPYSSKQTRCNLADHATAFLQLSARYFSGPPRETGGFSVRTTSAGVLLTVPVPVWGNGSVISLSGVNLMEVIHDGFLQSMCSLLNSNNTSISSYVKSLLEIQRVRRLCHEFLLTSTKCLQIHVQVGPLIQSSEW